jgi:hypothetical protein
MRLNLSIREQVRALFKRQEPVEGTTEAPKIKPVTPYQLAILAGLQGKQVYRGTVSAATKAKRRSKTSRQKASRKANRP